MKQCKILLQTATFMLFATLASCSSFSQNPVISTQYSDAEINNFVQNFNYSPNRDVVVDGVLLQNFKQHFTDTRDVEWETNDEIYKVEFEIQTRDYYAYYDKDGNLLLYKQDIHKGELPEAVLKAAKEKFPKYRFDDMDKIVKGSQTFYKVEMELGERDVTMHIASDGTILDDVLIY